LNSYVHFPNGLGGHYLATFNDEINHKAPPLWKFVNRK
jgi:hypothetical protein